MNTNEYELSKGSHSNPDAGRCAVHDLLTSMLPTEIVRLPVVGVDEAERVCGVPIRA